MFHIRAIPPGIGMAADGALRLHCHWSREGREGCSIWPDVQSLRETSTRPGQPSADGRGNQEAPVNPGVMAPARASSWWLACFPNGQPRRATVDPSGAPFSRARAALELGGPLSLCK